MFLRFLILLLFLMPTPLLGKERLVVFSAASQTDAMNEIGAAFEKQCKCNVVFSYAASSVLARQVDAGANADVFISASVDWVNWLEERNRIKSRLPFIGNRLMLVSGNAFTSALNVLNKGKFSMADPRSVPAGIYAKQALTTLQIWNEVQANAVFTENVRIALKLVIRGDLDASIVYQSDIASLPNEQKISKYVFPQDSHSRIEYVAAGLNDHDLSDEFISFLNSEVAQGIFERLGFLSLSGKNSE